MTPETAREIAHSLCAFAKPAIQDEGAEKCYRWALELDEHHAAAFNGLCRAALAKKDPAAAYRWGAQATLFAPESAEYAINTAVAAARLGYLNTAIAEAHRALRLDPKATNAHLLLSTICHDTEEYLDGAKWLDQGIEIQPDSIDLHWARAQCRLLNRQWGPGWSDWEYRYSRAGILQTLDPDKEWDGVGIGGSLLVIGEHGLGDQIMFARWIAAVKRLRLAGDIQFLTRRELTRLFTQYSEADRVVDSEEELRPWDRWILLSSLPLKSGIWIPPLCPGGKALKRVQQRATRTGLLKVGLCWKGNPRTVVDVMRPRDFERWWKPFLEIPGIEFQSLQLGECPDERMRPLPEGDLLSCANVIEDLDLVVTADTVIAHLSGSLGIPTWMPLYRPAEWRWGPEGSTSEWYRSIEIFRQRVKGDWAPVFADIRLRLVERLCHFTGENRSSHAST